MTPHRPPRAWRASMFVLTAVACVVEAEPAHAGRSRFGWLYGVETIPERGVELETWIFEENGKGDPASDETRLWFAPVVGITDRLELALPIELLFERAAGGEGETRLDRFGLEAHWRLMDPDPEVAGPFVVLLRLGAKRIVARDVLLRIEPGVVLALDLGRFHLSADLGGRAELEEERVDLEAQPGAGVSIAIYEELRLGAEVFAEFGVGDSTAVDWVAAGPTVSWTHGRFWLSASLPIGLHNIHTAPRVNWAIAF